MKLPFRLLALTGLVAATAGPAVAAGAPALHLQVFARTGIKLTGVLWAGSQFLYVENTTNTLYAGDAQGGPLHQFAALPSMTEETRCVVAPKGSGFPAGDIFCHIPDNRVFRISADGKTVTQFAALPTTDTSDGMLAFDTVGRFGHRLVAATGRSGGAEPAGGTVYTIDPAGTVRRVGDYPGPGGADEVMVAPADFGSIAGWALLTVDAGPTGAVVAMSPDGQVRTIAHLPDGPNPIALVPRTTPPGSSVSPGFYVADTTTMNVYRIPAAQLAPYAGDILVGTELKASFWYIRPRGKGFLTRRIATDLPAGAYNLEAGNYVP
jgi:hypothetical protein